MTKNGQSDWPVLCYTGVTIFCTHIHGNEQVFTRATLAEIVYHTYTQCGHTLCYTSNEGQSLSVHTRRYRRIPYILIIQSACNLHT